MRVPGTVNEYRYLSWHRKPPCAFGYQKQRSPCISEVSAMKKRIFINLLGPEQDRINVGIYCSPAIRSMTILAGGHKHTE